ncbi:MAG: metal-binding protein [Denitrovibrio sp.]|nr:MAG: metal-binding protein [Denitrovibrio sp.]
MSYKHFSNEACEYYPCHGLDNQNCLFCFCPLYFFKDCGGNPEFINKIKDCSNCVKNHDEKSYDFVMKELHKALSRLNKDLDMMMLNKL